MHSDTLVIVRPAARQGNLALQLQLLLGAGKSAAAGAGGSKKRMRPVCSLHITHPDDQRGFVTDAGEFLERTRRLVSALINLRDSYRQTSRQVPQGWCWNRD